MAEKYLVRLGRDIYEVEVEEGPEGLRAALDGRWQTVRLEQVGVGSQPLYLLEVDGHPYEAYAEPRAGGYEVTIGFRRYAVHVQTARSGRPPLPQVEVEGWQPAADGGWMVVSPMSGVVQEVQVVPGQTVHEGDVLLVIESMKMNNELRAQHGGTVREVYVEPGRRVEPGQALLLLA
ncbi:MAG TPA: biotin/lipoyl-containing protein [Dehalococcoidia bacterium]|nr:biotin/lipoyl-containing protein [Dehalococcoidia bacterium]